MLIFKASVFLYSFKYVEMWGLSIFKSHFGSEFEPALKSRNWAANRPIATTPGILGLRKFGLGRVMDIPRTYIFKIVLKSG